MERPRTFAKWGAVDFLYKKSVTPYIRHGTLELVMLHVRELEPDIVSQPATVAALIEKAAKGVRAAAN
jgi:hypothetical protein